MQNAYGPVSSVRADQLALLRRDIASLDLTQAAVARAVDSSQGQVSRVLAGKSGQRSKLLIQLSKYVEVKKKGVTARLVEGNHELIEALSSTWDGSPKHAQALALIIRSLGTLNPPR